MYYKCVECGNIFEEGEQRHIIEKRGLDCPPYHEEDVCPVCKGSYEKVERCECGAFDEILYHGFCENCILGFVDYENSFDYIIEKNELPYFIFNHIFGVDEPKKISPELMEELKMIYKRKKLEDLILQKPVFLGEIKSYIVDDLSDFADFLKKGGWIS